MARASAPVRSRPGAHPTACRAFRGPVLGALAVALLAGLLVAPQAEASEITSFPGTWCDDVMGLRYDYTDSDAGGVTYSFTPIDVQNGGPGGSFYPQQPRDDFTGAPVTFPFPFEYFGQTATDFQMDSNGIAILETGASGIGLPHFTPQFLPDATAPDGVVAPFWYDLDMSNGGMWFRTDGAAPNRVLRLEWSEGQKSAASAGPTGVAYPGYTFQLKFFEIDNSIEFHYQFVFDLGTTNGAMLPIRGIESAQEGTWQGGIYSEMTTPIDNYAIRFEPVPDAAPVVANDTYTMLEDDVLALTSTGPGAAINNTYMISDAGVMANDSDELACVQKTAALQEGPENGTLTLHPNGSFEYTPDPDWYGVDTFTYNVTDGVFSSENATVTINVQPVNDAPRFTIPSKVQVAPDAGSHTSSSFATDIDVGGAGHLDGQAPHDTPQTLTAIVKLAPGQASNFDVVPSLDPATGDLTFHVQDGITGSFAANLTFIDDGGTENNGSAVSATQDFTIVVEVPKTLTLVKNLGTKVGEMSTVDVDVTTFEIDHPSAPASEISINVTAIPGLGQLWLDDADTPLAVGDSFTFLDVKAGRLAYTSTGGNGDDSFGFNVTVEDEWIAGTYPVEVLPLEPPRASIGMPISPYFTGEKYTFTDVSLHGTYPILQRQWSLPGDAQSTQEAVTLLFSEPGTYSITLRITDQDHVEEITEEFEVKEYQPPQARFFSDRSHDVFVGEKVTFWDQTIPGNAKIVRTEWDFKDQVPGTADLIDEEVVTHRFTKPGVFQVTLRVHDAFGTVSLDTHAVVVKNRPEEVQLQALTQAEPKAPTADAGPDLVAVAGTVVRIEGKAESPTGKPLSIEWSHVAGTVLQLEDADTARPSFAVPHMLEGEAESVLSLAVSDGTMTVRDIVRIVLRNDGEPGPGAVAAPTARFSFEIGTGGQVLFSPLDGELPGPVYEWDFGDGHTSSAPHPDHMYSEPGSYSVRLTLRDAMGREATFSQPVTVFPAQAEEAESRAPAPQQAEDERGSGVLWGILTGVALVALVGVGLWAFLTRGPGQKP